MVRKSLKSRNRTDSIADSSLVFLSGFIKYIRETPDVREIFNSWLNGKTINI